MNPEERPGPERAAVLSCDGVGPALAKRRAEKGLSLDEVAGKLKFAPRQLEALEAGRFDALPQGTFLRGMVRGYARLLEMDPQPLLQAVAGTIDLPDADRLAARYSEPVPFSDPSKRLNVVYAVLSVAVLVVAGLVAFEWRSRTPGGPASLAVGVGASVSEPRVEASPAAPALAADSPPPQQSEDRGPQEKAEPAPEAASADAGSAAGKRALPGGVNGVKVVRFKFERESWVQVKDGMGHVLMSRLNGSGTQSAVEGEPPFSVVIGNAQHVRVLYEDTPVDLSPHIKVEVARFTLP